MHGRLKVRTDAEKAEAEKKQNEEKARQFRIGCETVFAMRNAGDKSDGALELTAKILTKNPDVYTLWNYRREILLERKKSVPEIISEDDFDSLCSNELDLVFECLLRNPKSYSCWHQRAWIMERMFKPNIEKEIALCDNALSKDSRNFHCWDYRRFLFRFAKIDIAQELEFTKKKIEENFSNFSSWYLRSCLLTEADDQGLLKVTDVWDQEYSMVENAIFTDPTDQSPWFFHKWLSSISLGNSLRPSSTNVKESQIQQILLTSTLLAIRFNNATADCPVIQVRVNDEVVKKETDFIPCPSSSFSQSLWCLRGTFSKVDITYKDFKTTISINQSGVLKTRKSFFEPSAQDRQLKADNLKNLNELLELEPDNKWINLSLSHLRRDKQNILDGLCALDPLRKNFFLDQKSREIEEQELHRQDWTSTAILMKNLGLTRLYSLEKMIHIRCLNLTGNNLSLISRTFNELVCLEILILDDNRIQKLARGLGLISLRVLSLQRNLLSSPSELFKLNDCPALESVYIFGNPLVNENHQGQLKKCPLFKLDESSDSSNIPESSFTKVVFEDL